MINLERQQRAQREALDCGFKGIIVQRDAAGKWPLGSDHRGEATSQRAEAGDSTLSHMLRTSTPVCLGQSIGGKGTEAETKPECRAELRDLPGKMVSLVPFAHVFCLLPAAGNKEPGLREGWWKARMSLSF